MNTKPGTIDWTILWGNLKLSSNILGKGNFGEVKEGIYATGGASVTVAVKTLKGMYFFKQRRKETDTLSHDNIVFAIHVCCHIV